VIWQEARFFVERVFSVLAQQSNLFVVVKLCQNSDFYFKSQNNFELFVLFVQNLFFSLQVYLKLT